VGSISIMLALRTTWTRRLTWLQPLVAIKHADLNITKLLLFLGKGLIIYASTNFVLQDVWTPPSRITTRALRDDHWLPSVLSTYDDSSGVHHLSHHFHHQSVLQPAQFQAMHMNHGFGASALSWLPVLPKLAERLKVRYSVAHDAPGFGFTDRSTNGDYTSEANAEIGIQLLRDKIALEDERPVVLMGHSMGALATLHMATKLPETTKLLIVLVSPALGLRRYKSSSQEKSKRKVTSKETSHGGFLDPVIQYVLKRAVG
jgi:pimeloyl-ACP methyl ester carboxylesterase